MQHRKTSQNINEKICNRQSFAPLTLFSSGGQGWNVSRIWFACSIDLWFLGIEKLLRKSLHWFSGLHVRFHSHHPGRVHSTFGREEKFDPTALLVSHPTLPCILRYIHIEIDHEFRRKCLGEAQAWHTSSVHILPKHVYTRNMCNTYVHEYAMRPCPNTT